MKENIYASCIAFNKNQGILFLGDSGMGKSDLCLRLIMQKNAVLVADDRVDISTSGNKIIANAPETIAGLLEVRGIGLQKFPYQANVPICLVVELLKNWQELERMPDKDFFEFDNCKIKKIKLCAFEFSAIEKIILALSH